MSSPARLVRKFNKLRRGAAQNCNLLASVFAMGSMVVMPLRVTLLNATDTALFRTAGDNAQANF